ncbi:MAG: macrolide ABC transporter ATP-binding protein [Tenericutes bacterium GWD2_38_27]|nr:MAG: macrolide ABC transporter ATP-binding protein [Tenericutes bacterium GWD2_38_27]OHE43655.1 MAG: macrolide ABC transporter ATP-binding protein [Tenericutes bacterium GWF2_38_8]HCB66090.1 macrolide ABC transporter ATP-binding protein [Acholeplasmataceae bacterium]
MEQIQVSNLKKSYQNQKMTYDVLKGIDFSVQDGEFVSICGPSGSGKTTLLYVLGGLEPYTGGSVKLFNQELKDYTESAKSKMRSQDIGFVFQFYNLIPNLTVYENILLSAILSTGKTKDKIMETLETVGMKDYSSYYPYQLSGGMQQRVAIARCLINDPKIIFADEPIGSLDHKNGIAIMELFRNLNQTYHKTILMVTHNEDTTVYGTRTLHMLDGKVIKDEQNT